MDQFEDQISTLMNYKPGHTAPFTAADITAGVRRRGRQRVFTVTASALAVAAVGVGAVSLAGNSSVGGSRTVSTAGGAATTAGTPPTTMGPAPTTAAAAVAPESSASPSSGRVHPASPVKTVASGERVDVAPGFQVYVTSHTKCDVESSPWDNSPVGAVPSTQCKDVNDGNFARDAANIAIQSSGSGQDYVMAGEYLGKTVPTSIGVDYGGKHYTATILRTAGQENWVAYYVRMAADGKAGEKGGTAVTAYDDAGKVLATTVMPMTSTAPPTTSPQK